MVDCAVTAGRGGRVGDRRAHSLTVVYRLPEDWLGLFAQLSTSLFVLNRTLTLNLTHLEIDDEITGWTQEGRAGAWW